MPIFRNASFAQRVSPRPGVTNNLTGVPLRMQIKVAKGSGAPLVELSTANGGINMVDAAAGVFDIVMSKGQTAELTVGTLFFDVVRDDTGARLFGGRVIVEDGVTS